MRGSTGGGRGVPNWEKEKTAGRDLHGGTCFLAERKQEESNTPLIRCLLKGGYCKPPDRYLWEGGGKIFACEKRNLVRKRRALLISAEALKGVAAATRTHGRGGKKNKGAEGRRWGGDYSLIAWSQWPRGMRNPIPMLKKK